MILEPDVLGIQAQRRSHDFGFHFQQNSLRKHRKVELRKSQCALGGYGAANGTNFFLKHENAGIYPIDRCQRYCAAHGRMTSERHLVVGCEDAYTRAMRLFFGRQNKYRFGEVELARNALHGSRIQGRTIQHYRERISGKRSIRKYIEHLIAEFGHATVHLGFMYIAKI